MDFFIEIALNSGEGDLRLDNGSCIMIPLSQGMYGAIEYSGMLQTTWSFLYHIDFLNEDEYSQQPLFSSDICRRTEILALYGKSVDENLKIL